MLKCTQIEFFWGSVPDPYGGAYSAPPDTLAGFKGPTSKEGEGSGGKGPTFKGRELGRGGRKGEGREEPYF